MQANAGATRSHASMSLNISGHPPLKGRAPLSHKIETHAGDNGKAPTSPILGDRSDISAPQARLKESTAEVAEPKSVVVSSEVPASTEPSPSDENNGKLTTLGEDSQGTLMVRRDKPNDCLVVISESAVADQAPLSSFQKAAENEAARSEVLGLFQDQQWAEQLKGSKLEEIKNQLAQPGTDVKALLSRALSEVEGGYAQAHQQRAQALSLEVAGALQATPETLETLKEVGGLFQIGKLAVPSEILNHQGKWPDDKRREWGGKINNMVLPQLAGPLLKAMGVSEAGRQAVFDSKQDYLVWNPAENAKTKLNPNWDSVPQAARILRLADSADSIIHNARGNSNDDSRSGVRPSEVVQRLQGQVAPEVLEGYLKL